MSLVIYNTFWKSRTKVIPVLFVLDLTLLTCIKFTCSSWLLNPIILSSLLLRALKECFYLYFSYASKLIVWMCFFVCCSWGLRRRSSKCLLCVVGWMQKYLHLLFSLCYWTLIRSKLTAFLLCMGNVLFNLVSKTFWILSYQFYFLSWSLQIVWSFL